MRIYDYVKEFKSKYPGGIGWRLEKHANVIEDYLNPGEEVKYAFYGQKNDKWYDILSTCVVVITNKRLLMGRKRMLWGSLYSQITPDLYNDMQVYRGLAFGKITIDTIKETVVITNLSKKALPEIETEISEFMINAKLKYKKREEKKDETKEED